MPSIKLIRGGNIVTPAESFAGDILVAGEQIAEVFRKEENPDCPGKESRVTAGTDEMQREAEILAALPEEPETVDASGLLVFPGFIDAHTHFDLHVAGTVTCDDFASGTRAAISGGTTTIIDFGTQYPGETLEEGLQNWLDKAKEGTFCDYGIHMSITEWNANISAECQQMMDEGVTTFKVYTTYDTMLEDKTLFEVLKRLHEVGGITGVHCENDGMITALREEAVREGGLREVASHYRTRPCAAEAEAIGRLLHLAEAAGAPMIDVHLTCGEGLQEIRAARARGQEVYAETCPQYLTMTRELYDMPGFEGAKYVISPPLREKSDCEALWKALAEGEIQTVSTDHCAFTMAQKELGREDFRKIPGGMPGVETRGMIMYSEGVRAGRISGEKMCEVLCENPAKLYGLYPRKGVIQKGADADLVLLDPAGETFITKDTQVSRCDYAPLEGKTLTGAIRQVYLRGEAALENGVVTEVRRGKFLRRGPYQAVVARNRKM